VATLIDDLTDKFLLSYDPSKGRDQVRSYPHYFLGSFVLSAKDNRKFIIDGQQRLTSITLLLMFLRNLAEEENVTITNVDDLIFSEQYGKQSFNIEVEERQKCMERLFRGEEIDMEESGESVRTMYNRYGDLCDLFPNELRGETLPYFVDWFIENVDMVEITAYSDDDAYTIFETMNDRGLALTPADMLKGYLLANMDDARREEANMLWKKRILSLIEDDRTEDEVFLKTWIRANYAETIRKRERGSTNQDYEKIANAFHKWVRDEKEKVGLQSSGDYFRFMTEKFDRYARLYLKIRNAESEYDQTLDTVFYNNYHTFPYQKLLILSAISLEDSDDVALKKMQLVSRYIEMFIVRRSVNQRTLGSSAIQYTMFLLVRELRDKPLDEIAQILRTKIEEMEESFDGVPGLHLHQQNKRFIRFLLSRITQHVESKSGIESSVEAYMDNKIKKPFEIEHILGDAYDQFGEGYEDEADFQSYRNSIGALVLLPRGFNQAFSNRPYEEKLQHYPSQNLWAWSLHSLCYELNPSFKHYISESGLPFSHHDQFGKEEITARCQLLKDICEEIWHVDRLQV